MDGSVLGPGAGGWRRGGGMRRAWGGSAWTGSTAMVMRA
jgi:hypothetical protein